MFENLIQILKNMMRNVPIQTNNTILLIVSYEINEINVSYEAY